MQEAIANLMKGRTVIVIAHRLSTVQSANKIAVLEQRPDQHDRHARGARLERAGLYQDLVRLQLSDGHSPSA